MSSVHDVETVPVEQPAPKRSLIKKIFRPLVFLTRINLAVWIVFGLIVGLIVGEFTPEGSYKWMKPWADVFIRMVKTLITPLIFSTLVVGIAGHGGELKAIGVMALKSIIYFEVASTIALVIGLVFGNVFKPGQGATGTGGELPQLSEPITWEDELKKIIPTSFFDVAARNEVLAIVFCALMFAVALIRVTNRKNSAVMIDFLTSLSDIMFKVTALVMNYAPIGIGFAIAATVNENGLEVLISLGKLVLTLYGALVTFVVVVLIPVMLICRIPPRSYVRAVARPWLIAFSTASSEAALPILMENLESEGLAKQVVGFVVPTGYSFNLDGSTLYLSLAVLFCAQAANIELSLSKQIVICITLMLTTKGIAAVPRASLVVLTAALESHGIPVETASLILGVDAFMDMARTSVNVLGNAMAVFVIARWEGHFPPHGKWEGRWADLDPRLQTESDLIPTYHVHEDEADEGKRMH